MAIELIKISEFPQVSEPGDWIVVSDASGTGYKISKEDFKEWLGTVTVIADKPISLADPAPTMDGTYLPTEAGTYTNAGGLVYDPEGVDAGKYVQFIKNDTVWTKLALDLPETDLSGVVQKSEVEMSFGKNIADPAKIQEGAVNSSGNIATSTEAKYIEIPISENTGYIIEGYIPASSKYYAVLDSSKTLIDSGSQLSSATTNVPAMSGAAWLRATVKGVSDPESSYDMLMIREAGTSDEYEPFMGSVRKILDTDIYAKYLSDDAVIPDSALSEKTFLKEEYSTVVDEYLNQFNKETVFHDRAINSSGNSVSAAGAGHTDYMEIVPNSRVWVRKITGSPSSGAWYDSDKNFISSITMPSGNGEITPIPPTNARFARVNIYNSSTPDVQANIDAFMLYSGTELVEYSPYKRLLTSIGDYYIGSHDGDQTPHNPLFNLGAMRNFRYKIIASETGLVVFALIGDSLTQMVPNSINYAREVSKILRDAHGNGGGGFYDFSRSAGSNDFMRSADIDDADDTRSGTVTYKDETIDAKGVNLAHGEFETGFSLALNIKTAHTGLVVHYYAGSGYGTFRYRIDGGAWNTVDASATSGHQTIPHAVPDDVHTMDFEVLSGMVILLGVDMQRDTGVRVHKLGNRGSRAHRYPEVNRQVWIDALSSLDIDSSTILLGTNDRTVGELPEEYHSNMKYLIDMIYDATPEFMDIGLIGPSNNPREADYGMIEYNKKLLSLAKEYDLPFVDLIPLFGSPEQILDKGTFSDQDHPTTQGGKMIARYLVEKLFT